MTSDQQNERMEHAVGDSAAAFLFADIAGFTALTEAHGDEAAFQLIDAFSDVVEAELVKVSGQRVKTIGDALMLRVPDPAEAIHLAHWIAHDAMREHGSPAVRVGCHYGTAIERNGDYFGNSVNLAARVSSAAAGGEALVTGQTAALVPDLDGVIFESRGRQMLRNVGEPIGLFAILRASDSSLEKLPIDPVCRMSVTPDHAAGELRYQGTVFSFCSLTCAAAFAQDPERYAG
jgi:class 3 adenylate cyclase/YHS domain-containing protein